MYSSCPAPLTAPPDQLPARLPLPAVSIYAHSVILATMWSEGHGLESPGHDFCVCRPPDLEGRAFQDSVRAVAVKTLLRLRKDPGNPSAPRACGKLGMHACCAA